MNAPLLAFWLIPAEPYKSCFAELINVLATKFDAPVFEPHVTIHATHLEPVLIDIARALHGVHPITLHFRRIAFSSQFTKTLFVEFAPSETLSSLSRELKNLAPNPSGYVLEPHLSLIYKTLTESEKAVLADAFAAPFSEVLFDEIKVITGNPTVTRSEDVASWKTLGLHRLS